MVAFCLAASLIYWGKAFGHGSASETDDGMFHAALGEDTLWFKSWVPSSAGAMFGACVGLFLLALVERYISSIRALMEVSWRQQAQIAYTNKTNASRKPVNQSLLATITLRNVPPFIPSNDIPRGLLHAAQSALGFLCMLAIMTFQVGFLISVVVGLSVGEVLFGRFLRATR